MQAYLFFFFMAAAGFFIRFFSGHPFILQAIAPRDQGACPEILGIRMNLSSDPRVA